MKHHRPLSSRIVTTPLACAVAGLIASPLAAPAAVNDYFWTAAGAGDGGTASGGTGIWDTSSALWRNDVATGTLGTYPAAGLTNNARFGGTAGIVTLAPSTNVLANQLIFSIGGYSLAGASGSTITLNGANPTITPSTGVTTIDAVLAGSAGLVKAGAGLLILNGANTFTGIKSFSAGTTRVSSIGTNASTSSNLGGSGALVLGGGTLEYTGAGESSNRAIQFFAASRIDNYGFGTLTLSGTFTASQAAPLGLTSGGSGNVTFTNVIADNSVTNRTSLSAIGAGAVTLSGANTFTGGLVVGRNSNLVLDYATNATVVNAGNAVTLGSGTGGTLTIKGRSTGATSQSLGALTFSTTQNSIIIDPNGGAGTTLNLGVITRNNAGNLLIDLGSGGGVTANLSANAGGGAINLQNGVLANGQSATSSIGVVVKTAAGYDFATGSGQTAAATISALGSNTDLVSTGGSTATNYKVSGNKTITGATTSSTIRVDTTAGAGGTLTINSGQTLTLGKNSILFDGTGSYNLAGPGTLTGTAAMFFQQWSSGTVTIGNNVVFGAQRIDKFGTGLLVNNSTSANLSQVNVYGGVYRAGTAAALGGANSIALATGGILEVTADFTRSLGTGATSTVQFLSDGGFSAFGGNRAVSIGGAGTPTALTWGSTANFLASGSKLLLSASTSDSTVDFQNPIDFNGLQREVNVGNGSASVDAKLSGALTGAVAGSGLFKTGAGTLEVSSTNNYTGPTTVNAGTLLVSGAISGTTTVEVSGGGTLLLGGVGADRIRDAAPVTLGAGATPGAGGTFQTGGLNEGPVGGASGSTAAMGTLTLTANSTLDFSTGDTATGSNLLFAGLNYTPGTAVRILNWTGAFGQDDGSAGNDRLLFTSDPGFSSAQLSAIQFFSDNGSTPLGSGGAQIAFNGYIEIVPIPEPSSTALLGAFALLGLIGWRERRRLLRA